MSERFLLDTNVLSEFNQTGKPNENVMLWLEAAAPESLFVSIITVAEIQFGIELLLPSKRRTQLEQWMEQGFNSWFADKILPLDRDIVNRWAALSAKREREGQPIAQFDGLIAATALKHGLTLVTRNIKDFRDLGLTLLNPWDARSQEPRWPQAREEQENPPAREAPDYDIEH